MIRTEGSSIRAALRRLAPAGVLLLALALASCYPGEISSVSESFIVVTNYNDQVEFPQLRTYAMPDTIVHLKDLVEDENLPDVTRRYDQDILEQVASILEEYNWERIPVGDVEANEPDMVLLLTVGASTTDYYWSGGGGCYWWWYPCYGCCSWYPPVWGTVSYTVGTLFMTMGDPRDIDDSEDLLPLAWLGVINGLIGQSSGDMSEFITAQVNQAFVQSPYLQLPPK